MQPHEYMHKQSDTSVVYTDPFVNPEKLQALWQSQVYQPAGIRTDDETETKQDDDEPINENKIALVEALHRAWDLQAKDCHRNGEFIYIIPRNKVATTPHYGRSGHSHGTRAKRSTRIINRHFQQEILFDCQTRGGARDGTRNVV